MRIDEEIETDKGTKILQFNVAGITFIPNCNKIFEFIWNNYCDFHLSEKSLPPIRFVADPNNQFDENAIKIEAKLVNKRGKEKFVKIGYVPRGDEDNPNFNVRIKRIMDRNRHKVSMKDFYYMKPENSLNTPNVYVTVAIHWMPNNG
tara:strand:- start:7682 stop:8122 length:441 start_codon:yes stop_codon:yes gene_type:complete